MQNYREDEDVVITSIKNFLKTFIEFKKISLKYKFFILSNLIIGVSILTTLIYFYLPKHYITKSSFIAPPSNMLTDYSDDLSLSLKGMGLNNLFPQQPLLLTDPNGFWIEILKSRAVYEYIDTKNKLKEKKSFKYIEDVFNYLGNVSEIKSDKGLIKIEVKTLDKNEGVKISEGYIEKMSMILNEMNISKTKEQKVFLENRIEKVHTNLLEASNTLAKFNKDKKILDLESQGKGLIETLTKLKAEVISLEAKLSVLKETYTDNSPKVKALNANIEVLRQKIGQLSGQQANNTGELSITEIPSASIDYIEKTRNAELLAKILETLTKEYEILKIKEAKGNLSLKVIDKPKASEREYGTNKKLVLLLGIIVLLLINFLFVSIIFLKNKLKEIDPNIYSSLSKIKS